MSMRSRLVAQFKRPTGLLGGLAGWVMAHRSSNVRRNLWTIDLLAIEPTDRVLEIGCGPGVALAAAIRRAPSGLVIGIDHSRVMVRQAARRNAGAINRGRAQVREMSVEDASALGQTFDKVYSANVAQFFADQTEAFRTLASIMTPGGLIATTYQPRMAMASAQNADAMAGSLRRTLAALGFLDICTERLDLKPAPAVCVLARTPKAIDEIQCTDHIS